jgi:hypothetical protein
VAIIALDVRHEAARSPRQDSTAAPRATAAAPASVTSQEAPPVASESTAQADAEPALGTSALETETQPAEAQAEPTLLEEASAETAAESSTPCVDRNGAPLPQDSWLCRGQVVHGAPPPADAPPTVGEQPAAPADASAAASAPIARVPPYQTASAQRLGAGTRVRYEVSVLVPADYGRDEMMAVLTHAVRQTLAQRHDAEAVGVFAYSSPVQIGKGYDKGRALVSRDGRGWTGDGTFDVLVPGLVDRGKIYVTLGTVLAAYEQAAVDR